MRKSVAPFAHTLVAALMAAALAFSMVPLAWADDGPTGTVAGTVAGNAAEGSESPEDAAATEGMDGTASSDAPAPEAEVQSADAKAADSTGDAATGTTIKIAVYRSSYPLIWDLNDAGAADATKAKWDSKPEKWPTEGSPGSAVGTCEGYVSWTDDKDPGSEPSRTGFNFLGWSTKPAVAVEGAGKLDTLSIPKDTQPAEGEDGAKSITLYALWAPINYSVAFDLTKNPEDASATPSFNWTTGKGTFSDLGGGRYRLSGVTLQDYDPATGLIEISTPSRGTGGYRFLSWAEPDSQQDPTVAVKKAGSSKWYVNPVALPHYDYEPVLTARWSLSFDVDVPSQVTFDEYDSLEVEGNLTDTTDEDAIDEESPDAHDAGKRAHFCSQSTATDYKIVALRSVRQETASKILTTSDSAKATQEEVLGSERLLSLFAEGATAESQGVHFKLDDDVDMDDSSRYGSFVIPKQAASFDPTATERDDESRLYVSYRLNLSNKVGGSETPNHGLVTPGSVNEGDRTPIAEVSYEFAVADGEAETEIGSNATGSLLDDFFIQDGTLIYGPANIKAAANDIARNGTTSRYYEQYDSYLSCGMAGAVSDWSGNKVSGKVRWDDNGDGVPDTLYDVRIIGILYDKDEQGKGIGLTFQFVGILNRLYGFNDTNTNIGGWGASKLQQEMNSGSIWKATPSALKNCITPACKTYRDGQYTSNAATISDRCYSLFLPSYAELTATPHKTWTTRWEYFLPERSVTSRPYDYYSEVDGTTGSKEKLAKATATNPGVYTDWWIRSQHPSMTVTFVAVDAKGLPSGRSDSLLAKDAHGVSPCFAI